MKISSLAFGAVALAGLAIVLPSTGIAQDPPKEPAKTTKLKFDNDIVPIIKANCLGCHNKDKHEHNVQFPDKMTEADAIKDARLWWKSAREAKSLQMPPKNVSTMGDKDRAKLVEWVEAKVPRPARRPGGGPGTPPSTPPSTTGGGY